MKTKLHTLRVILIQKKWWTAALCLWAAALMVYAANYPAAVGASVAARQLPIYCVQQDQKLVSISFDAAWDDVRMRRLGRKGTGAHEAGADITAESRRAGHTDARTPPSPGWSTSPCGKRSAHTSRPAGP